MAKSNRPNRGLGRGLSALMSDVAPTEDEQPTAGSAKNSIAVPIEQVYPNPDQPRKRFDDEALEELAQSIRHNGVIQPLIVRHRDAGDTGRYQIVAGERRWRASQKAGLHEIPVLVREFTDQEVLEVAIVENIQRADLNAIDEGLGYKQLIDTYGHTQEQLSEFLGKSRSHIANQMRLLNLPEEVKTMVSDGKLSAGHARAVLTADDPIGLARQIVSKGLSVRDAEKKAKSTKSSTRKSGGTGGQKDADTVALESELSAQLKMAVRIDHSAGADGGRVSIAYKSLDQLDDLVRLLSS